MSENSIDSLIFKNAEQKLKLDGQVSKGGIVEEGQQKDSTAEISRQLI